MADEDITKVGIIGVGFVGGAARQYFETLPLELFLYDKYKKLGSVEDVNRAQVIFVATPTPFVPETGFDLSFVEGAAAILTAPKIIVIKSSVVPGTTDKLQEQFPQHKFLFNPEFLREASAYNDFINPDRQILGTTAASLDVAEKVLRLLPKSAYEKIMPANEAEVVKYMANTFLAMKVVFANEFYSLCKDLGINYETVKEAVSQDPRIGASHLDADHGGYRGYGGSCFPKDVNAIIQFANNKGIKMPLLEEMRAINRGLLKKSNLDEDYFLTGKHKKT